MMEEAGGGPTEPVGMPISAIFVHGGPLTPENRSSVVSRVLNDFPNLPDSPRQALRSAVNDEITLAAGGFRRGQTGRALDGLRTILQEPIERKIQLSDKLACAVLRCWAESLSSLREDSERYLTGLELAVPGPDLAARSFRGTWTPHRVMADAEAFCHAHDQYERDEVALMLCYVSGNIPLMPQQEAAAREVSEALSIALEHLKKLPATSQIWENEIPIFASSVSRMIEEKAAQLRWASDFESILDSLRREFAELLAFFEQDTHQWSARRVSHEADTAAALGLVENLHSLLTEYRLVHDRAPSITEERERGRSRDALQPSVMDALQDIDALMTEEHGRDPGDLPIGPTTGEQGHAAGSPSTARSAGDAGRPTGDRLLPRSAPQVVTHRGLMGSESHSPEDTPSDTAVAVADRQGISTHDYVALQSEVGGLRNNSDALRSENQDLREEVETLKTELYSSQEMEESWRIAYRSAFNAVAEEEVDDQPGIESVNSAVEMARGRFKQELLFAPNSESSIEDNPFTDPGKVWEALQWLATTYYASRMGRLRVTDFNQSIKEACGWWYKGDQGETTLSRYEKSYTTRVEGKRHWLAEHIGKGTTFDARYTIRIAFDWDRERRRVIVGYLGRHQQTDAS